MLSVRYFTLVAGAAAVAVASISAAPAHAQSLTLDTPNAIITRPASGTTTFTFTGTIVNPANARANYASLVFPYNSSLNTLPSIFSSDFNAWYVGAGNANGATYSGGLFTVDVSASTPLGLYNRTFFNAGAQPSFAIGWSNGASQQDFYTANVVSAQTGVVPEPSEWAVIGMTATTLGGLMVRARRRKGSASDSAATATA